MAQTQIRKGFFFYFGLLVLLLIAVFLVLLVVMMFNPGKTILWMQYFAGNEHPQVVETTDGQQINFETVSKIEVNCSYADVYIQKNENIKKNCIDIINNSKGFTVASDAKEFSYDVTVQEGVLKINVVEPTGFIYLSKDIQIKVNLYDTPYDYSNNDIIVKTTSGNVSIGGSSMNGSKIAPKSLDITTESGNIYFTSMGDVTSTSRISLKTNNGSITAIENNWNGVTGLVTNSGDVSITNNSGVVSFDTVKSLSKVKLTTEKGKFVFNKIETTVVEIDCFEGNFDFGTVVGNLTFTTSEDKIISPNINIKSLTGDFTLTATEGLDSKPKINIDKIVGNIDTFGTDGDLIFKELTGYANIEVGSGNINLTFADSTDKTLTDTIKTTSANVVINFKGDYGHTLNLTTNTGLITFNVTAIASFNSEMFVNDEEGTTYLGTDKITVNIGHIEGDKNPLVVSGNGNVSADYVKIWTNNKVIYNLVDSI